MDDSYDHDGYSSGYTIYSTKRGSSITIKWFGNSQKETGKDLADTLGTGIITSGTGQLSGIKGFHQYKGTFNWKSSVIHIDKMVMRYQITAPGAEKAKS